ncbi:MAG: type II toxin-antitoxin system HicA family toxin [Bacteroidota bacterium]
MKVRDVLKMLRKDGWVLARTDGSYRQFKHGDELAPGILKQAGLKQ